ncbi:MAG: hypothetical protein FJ302_00865 [Planctomycetes bacterium]|nr:hypothetical protein [Planctomycetota bacterium]
MAKSKTIKPSKSATRDWIIRGVGFGALAVLLVFARLDFQSKQAAQTTSEAWRAAIRAKGEDVELLKSEFDKIPVQRSPQLVSSPAGANPYAARTIETYTWSGIFRNYSVKVYVGAGTDPPIESIQGPGEDTQPE